MNNTTRATWQTGGVLACALFQGFCAMPLAQANPEGLTVAHGSAHAVLSGSHLHVTASHNAFLNWASFNIGPGQTTTFIQPSAASIVWNRIHDSNPSEIHGRLEANGFVVLANPSGFYFGPDAFVRTAGFLATTAPLSPLTAPTTPWEFRGMPPLARIINHGHIETEKGGSLFLISRHIQNHGSLAAPEGTVTLAAGDEVLLTERPDGRGLATRVRIPEGSIDNQGRIIADAGSILLAANAVNQGGIVQANTVRRREGVIELLAAETLRLEAGSSIAASGDRTGASPGGTIRLRAGGDYIDHADSSISAPGGLEGGDGGRIEISAARMPAIRSSLDATAVSGWRSGSLVIDPTDIHLGRTGDGEAPGGTVPPESAPETLRLNVNSAFQGFARVTLEATRDIRLEEGTHWNLEQSTGVSSEGSLLTLRAGRDIQLQDRSRLLGGEFWSVSLESGADLSGDGEVQRGIGNVQLQGTALIETGKGSIEVNAGDSMTVSQGAIRTTQAGDIDVRAMAGNVNAGTNPNGYHFGRQDPGYQVSPELGGISTASGGDVRITAGGDVISFLPTLHGVHGDAGSGAFGAEPGDVTITAGGSVFGHYVLRNGEGRIQAANHAGLPNRLLALSLVNGSWRIEAGHTIGLQEVRNPNGVFNYATFNNPFFHRFDYHPASSVTLVAGHGVVLSGLGLPRMAAGGLAPLLYPIYPPRLEIDAGAGGIELAGNLSLFPSPLGSLTLRTTDGGDLRSSTRGVAQTLVMSDSGRQSFTGATDFGLFDHAPSPVHLDNPEPAFLSIDGSMRDVVIGLPKQADILVGRDVINSSLIIQHLDPEDVTRLYVGRDILNRNEWTIVPLHPDSPRLDPLPFELGLVAQSDHRLPTADSLYRRIVYLPDPVNPRLAFRGRMRDTDRQSLLSLKIKDVMLPPDPSDPFAQYVPYTFLQPNVVEALYAGSQDIPEGSRGLGYQIEGPGTLDVRARNLDLGVTVGIASRGFIYNPYLAPVTPRGADIHVRVDESLSMFSSAILSEFGGRIRVSSGGGIDVGSAELPGGSDIPRGIISLGQAEIEVVAVADINVQGSRIAAYDGGNIEVVSLTGNVDAGSGGQGYARIQKPYRDPVTGRGAYLTATIPGSGILATSYPLTVPGEPPTGVGSIVVRAPQGDIKASAGGVVQMSLNASSVRDASVKLIAGTRRDTPDGQSEIVYRGSIDSTGSGVIGGQVSMEATGDIIGLVFARTGIDITSQQSVSVTALSQGDVNLSGQSVSGTVVGTGGINVSGESVTASLVSQNISSTGDLSGASLGVSVSSATAAGSTAAASTAQETTVAAATQLQAKQEDDLLDATREKPSLASVRGRVTVVLPEE